MQFVHRNGVLRQTVRADWYNLLGETCGRIWRWAIFWTVAVGGCIWVQSRYVCGVIVGKHKLDQEGEVILALWGFAGPVDPPRTILETKIGCKASGDDAADAGGASGHPGGSAAVCAGVSMCGRDGAEKPWRNGSLS